MSKKQAKKIKRVVEQPIEWWELARSYKANGLSPNHVIGCAVTHFFTLTIEERAKIIMGKGAK